MLTVVEPKLGKLLVAVHCLFAAFCKHSCNQYWQVRNQKRGFKPTQNADLFFDNLISWAHVNTPNFGYMTDALLHITVLFVHAAASKMWCMPANWSDMSPVSVSCCITALHLGMLWLASEAAPLMHTELLAPGSDKMSAYPQSCPIKKHGASPPKKKTWEQNAKCLPFVCLYVLHMQSLEALHVLKTENSAKSNDKVNAWSSRWFVSLLSCTALLAVLLSSPSSVGLLAVLPDSAHFKWAKWATIQGTAAKLANEKAAQCRGVHATWSSTKAYQHKLRAERGISVSSLSGRLDSLQAAHKHLPLNLSRMLVRLRCLLGSWWHAHSCLVFAAYSRSHSGSHRLPTWSSVGQQPCPSFIHLEMQEFVLQTNWRKSDGTADLSKIRV